MLSLERQEMLRTRYGSLNAGWKPSSQVYEDRVATLISPRTAILDLGCGRGGVVERLHTQARLATGVDPDWTSVREHRACSLPLVLGEGERLPYSGRSADIVCCSWVLEHLPNPAVVFEEVARVLAPGGSLVFVTPNISHPLIAFNRIVTWGGSALVGQLYDRARADTFPAFYRANSPRRIERLATYAGLKVQSIELIGDPTYLAFTELLFRVSCLLERALPRRMRVHLVGECVAE
jgi:SAM-dependent methyltransferase